MHTKICHCYTESVKFGLILTHLKLFFLGGRAIWGARIFSGEGEISHMFPSGTTTAYVLIFLCNIQGN